MSNDLPFRERSSVQTHLTIMQNVILRMAENSRSCKLWCVTIVSAVLVFTARLEAEKVYLVLASLPPIVLLFCLDAQYLSRERGFRNAYNKFVEKMQSGVLHYKDIYVVSPTNQDYLRALTSWSVWIFYAVLLISVIGVYLFFAFVSWPT